ncbi:MAG TPA: hypothetical protein VES97_11700 [Solirubrobacteraceae bacterium]|nr:hypothetical protein [Solirubrobacteraceae bacterium]
MRRASTCLAVLGLAVLGLSSVASADPTVVLKVKVVPIPGVPHTGYHLGWGAAQKTEYTIKGSEYGGFPPPLIGVNYFLPAGLKLHPQGFPTCPVATLEKVGFCSKASQAGPVGSALGVVAFGTTRVPETVSVQPYFAPGGGLEFYSEGRSPTIIELISKGHFTHASGLFGEELIAEVPLVETVQGAPDGSVEHITVQVGAAYKKSGKWTYYGTVPKKCPKGGFPVKSEMIFANTAMLPERVPGAIVKSEYKVPCPH